VICLFSWLSRNSTDPKNSICIRMNFIIRTSRSIGTKSTSGILSKRQRKHTVDGLWLSLQPAPTRRCGLRDPCSVNVETWRSHQQIRNIEKFRTWQHRYAGYHLSAQPATRATYRTGTLCQQPFAAQATQRKAPKPRGNCRARHPSSETPMAANPCALARRPYPRLAPLVSLTDDQG
jgi:hypothetical protein